METRLLVLCDTNVYRAHKPEEFERVRQLERSLGIKAVVSQWVLLELFSHLYSDPEDKSFQACWRGLKSMYAHAAVAIDGVEQLPIFASPRHDLERQWFAFEDTKLRDAVLRLATIARNVGRTSSVVGDLLQYREAFRSSGQHLAEREDIYVRGLEKRAASTQSMVAGGQITHQELLKIIRTNGLRWAAGAMIHEMEARTGNQLLDRDRERAIDELLTVIPASIYFQYHIFESMANSGGEMDLSRQRNSVWDRELALYITPHFRSTDGVIGHAHAIVVTNENRIHRAASAAGQPSHAIKFDHYLHALESGDSRVLPLIQ